MAGIDFPSNLTLTNSILLLVTYGFGMENLGEKQDQYKHKGHKEMQEHQVLKVIKV